MKKEHNYKTDIAVLILFFCRDEQFSKVFEAVKEARPSRLYLYQDGPREGNKTDIAGIQRCREIADDKNIDWECEVHRLYQEKNYGCDPSEYIAQKWMFETEEMGIILEDDDVPSQSFFPFCKELLEKYKDDHRINMVCGMNNTGVSKHVKDSYLFTNKGSIWGWASWRRVLDSWDAEYSWLDDEEKISKMSKALPQKEFKVFLNVAQRHRNSGRAHYESINAAAHYLNGRINIVPKYNMISNIGVSSESTHSTDDVRVLPHKVRKLFFMKTYEIDFPLIHPAEIKRDFKFEKEMTITPVQKFFGRIEHMFLLLKYKGMESVKHLILKKVKNKM